MAPPSRRWSQMRRYLPVGMLAGYQALAMDPYACKILRPNEQLVGLLAHVRSVLVRPGWICPLAPVVRPQCLVHWHNLTVLPCRLMTFQNIAPNWSKKHYVSSTIVCGPQRCQTA